MTDTPVASFSSAAMRCKHLAADLGCLFHRALQAHETRRALSALPDDMLQDIGLTRSEIPYVANALAAGESDPAGDPGRRLHRSAADLCATSRNGAPVGIAQ